MPDITLEINEAIPIVLGITNQAPVNLDIVDQAAITLGITNQADVSLDMVNQSPVVLNFGYGGVIATIEQLATLLSEFDEYDSDEAAAIGGVASMGWYRTSDGHVTVPGGMLKQNRL